LAAAQETQAGVRRTDARKGWLAPMGGAALHAKKIARNHPRHGLDIALTDLQME
jgi:hypothetical protein